MAYFERALQLKKSGQMCVCEFETLQPLVLWFPESDLKAKRDISKPPAKCFRGIS